MNYLVRGKLIEGVNAYRLEQCRRHECKAHQRRDLP